MLAAQRPASGSRPGRKTDVADATWICELIEHGLVRPSFVPPRPIRRLRGLTRYRKAVIEERAREVQRLDKVLEDAGIKLASVASKTLTVSGRAMLDALVAGQRDPQALAELARGRMRAKIPALRDAGAGEVGIVLNLSAVRAATDGEPDAPSTVAIYVLLLAVAQAIAARPVAFYDDFLLEQRYGLSLESRSDFIRGQLRASLIFWWVRTRCWRILLRWATCAPRWSASYARLRSARSSASMATSTLMAFVPPRCWSPRCKLRAGA